MSSRGKRKFDFDPNASDPEDLDYDVAERPTPQRSRRRQATPGGSKRKAKRQRRGYGGSDVDHDDDIVTDDSFTDRSSSEELEINPSTGRSVRRATKKEVKYEESEEDAIQDTTSEDEIAPHRRRAKEKEAKETKRSLIVILKISKMPEPSSKRNLRARTGSKSIVPATTRGKTPDVAAGMRRSSRLSHDVEEPIVALSDSGKHINLVRQGTRSPEPVLSARMTRGGKGPRGQQPSAIMEASQETSMVRDDSAGPLDGILDEIIGGNETQVQDSHEGSPEHQAQVPKDDDADDEDMEGVIQESQQEHPPEDSEEEGPVTRGARNLRSRAKSEKRKRGADDSSDFEPGAEEEKGDEEMSASDHPKGRRFSSEDSGSGSGRRSARIRAKTRQSQRSRRNTNSSEQDSVLDAEELAEEAQELATTKRRRLARHLPDRDLAYDTAAKSRNRARATVDYRLIRPEQNAIFDDDDAGPSVNKSRSRGGNRSGYRSLFTVQGPFGGGFEGGVPGASAVGGIDSDSSDDEARKAPRGIGGTVGMTPTTATAPGFAFPQTHSADPQQGTGAGGGPADFGRVKDKKALADADPLGVDPNVNFDGVGGLDDHINKLKEMIMLPLLYPEVFQRFKVTPPRGVLFHGPPGTGKTLLARALASSVSSHGQKVTFYMRKGADALSKWVGEAERQLRLLFDEARKTQPSIIFFDEIDGLAPVRSSKQDQIHSSLVATLLALMDGMDGRGQVVVIGATNRPDSVDPALRRPGRFDREFYFPLPNVVGRRAIIDIHTKNWDPPIKPEMKDQLAEITKGYGGADLRALCTEAALNAVQGTYPQIYQSERKLLIEPANIKILAKDFMISVAKMVPSSQRTVSTTTAPLAKNIEPLLRKPLEDIQRRIDELIPRRKHLTALEEAQYDDRDDEKGFEREATLRNMESGRIFRPRLLINGLQGMGQQYLGAALLNKVEGLHVQSFDLSTILEDPSRSHEAAITQLFTEVRRHKPSVIYIPYVDIWYQTLPAPAIKTFKLLLRSIPANDPILLLGLMEQVNEKDTPDQNMMKDLFSFSQHNQFMLKRPDQEGRAEFFNGISHYIRMSPADFPDLDNRKKRVLPELEFAPFAPPKLDPPTKPLSEKQQAKQDRLTLNKLKVAIQPVMDELKRKYRKFAKPLVEESWYAYLVEEQDPSHFSTDLQPEQQQEQGMVRPWELTKDTKGTPMIVHVETGKKYYNLDLSTIEKRLSNGFYTRPKDFLTDIKTLNKDAKTYGQDLERLLKTNEMVTNVEVDMETIKSNYPPLVVECEALYLRTVERYRKAEEERAKLIAEGKDVPHIAPVPLPQPATTADTSGPIVLGEPIPGRFPLPPVTPSQLFPLIGPLSNGTSTDEGSHARQNGSTVPSRSDEDAHLTDTQDLNTNTQHKFQTPSRVGTQNLTQTQRSQASARTFMPPNSHHGEYHNSASTTTSGQKTSDRSSGARFNNTQSTNGATPSNFPDFSEIIARTGGSQVPDTQELPPYVSSQPSNSEPSQSSQHNNMPAPAPPRHSTNIQSLLNDEAEKPQVILDEEQLWKLHDSMVKKSSGCSVEQLEQISAALMASVWKHRAEYNRNKVIHEVQASFNEIIEDIQKMQEILKWSQDEPDYSQAPPGPSTVYGQTQLGWTGSQPAWGVSQPTGQRPIPMESSQF